MRAVFIGLGSNLGDRQAALRSALDRLSSSPLQPVRHSSLYRSDPVEVTDQQEFINQVTAWRSDLPAEELLDLCLEIERGLGRVRSAPKGPRVIDLDLLLAGDDISTSGRLELPHPRLHLRRFVLEPLCEIAPDAWHPVLRRTAADLLRACPDRSRVERIGD